jgi:predicted SprT family Zn-dependent metalloprotease
MSYKITCKRGKNVTVEDRVLVLKMVKQCMTELNKQKHEIGFDVQKSFWKPLHVDIKKKSQKSYGSESRISIDVSEYHKGGRWLNEYAAYRSDPVIGERTQAATPESVLFGVVAHEIAHHVQYAYGPHTRMYKSTCKKSHGDAFQDIYRILRSTLVNPQLDAEADRIDADTFEAIEITYKLDQKIYKDMRAAYKRGEIKHHEIDLMYRKTVESSKAYRSIT